MPYLKNQTIRPTRGTLGADGSQGKKSLISYQLASVDLGVPAAGSATAITAPTAANASSTVTVAPNFVLPTPRNVTITSTGTAGDVKAAAIVVTGKNIEGKTITENLTPTLDTLGTVTGSKIFHTVTSVAIPAQDGAGVSYSVGVGNLFGINVRNLSTTQVRLVKKVVATGVETLVTPGSTNFSSTVVEDNYVTLDTTANGLNQYYLYAFAYNWQLNPVNDNPNYGF